MQRHFLDWRSPLPPRAAQWLLKHTGNSPSALSEHLVLVPTQESGRLLRQALSARANALLTPRVHTPESLWASLAEGIALAGPLERDWAWSHVINAHALQTHHALFPKPPETITSQWAANFGTQIETLKVLLAENALTLEDAMAQLQADSHEIVRWRSLVALEQAYRDTLASIGLSDRQSACIQRITTADNLQRYRTICLIGLPDMLPALKRLLEPLEKRIDVLVYAPEELAEGFDAWGLPLPEFWEHHSLPLEPFAQHVRVHPNPEAMAQHFAHICAQTPEPSEHITLGLSEPRWATDLQDAFEREGLCLHNPEGLPGSQSWWVRGLRALAASLRNGRLEDLCKLASWAPVRTYLSERGTPGDLEQWLREADLLREQHLVQTLQDSLACARRTHKSPCWQRVTTELDALLKPLRQPPLADALLRFLGALTQSNTLTPGKDFPLVETPVVKKCLQLLERLAALEQQTTLHNPLETLETLIAEVSAEPFYPPHSPQAIDVKGWLELLWDEAPVLHLGGIHEGNIPSTVDAHWLLPHTQYENLGLRTNAQRYARDAYLLSALIESRRTDGAISLHHVQHTLDQTPLKPSRLLFQGSDQTLCERLRYLLCQPTAPKKSFQPPSQPWIYELPEAPLPPRLSVTALRDYLSCPLDFYLKHLLRLESLDAHKNELSAGDFGTLCHSALEALGRESALSDCTDPMQLRTFLEDQLSDRARLHYGRHWGLPLHIQCSSARERLAAAAHILARERANGWVVQAIEWTFSGKNALVLNGMAIHGKVDRIERHEVTGRWRVLDFKTRDRPETPQQAHLGSSRSPREHWQPYCYLPDGKRVWKDLQLPLYHLAVQATFGEDVDVGYLLMPQAATQTQLALWDNLDAATIASARDCACGIVKAVRAGHYLPLGESSAFDTPLGKTLREALRINLSTRFIETHHLPT